MTSEKLQLTDLDRRIWEEELSEWVPKKIFDQHSHIYRWADNLDPDKNETGYAAVVKGFELASAVVLDECDALLMPGRQVNRLAFPFPFPQCNFAAANEFLATELAPYPESSGLMLVHPNLTADEVESTILKYGFVGLKPYRNYSITGDIDECRITDFLPESQIAVADRYGLLIMMHMSMRRGIADERNQRDLLDLSAKYPNARWILAHCARSYSAWPLEAAAKVLRQLPNVWYGTSSVCETDAFDALYSTVGIGKVMYGSDDVPIGVMRGKYIAWGQGWAYLTAQNQSLKTTHCDGRFTFVRYEQLRAMRRATERYGATKAEIAALFHDTAESLVKEAKLDLRSAAIK
jgi:glutamate-1-semialdehyde 2,1-aminomutase